MGKILWLCWGDAPEDGAELYYYDARILTAEPEPWMYAVVKQVVVIEVQ